MTLLDEQGKTQKDLIQFLGLANGVFTTWRYHGVKSYMKYIDEISDFFGTEPGYILYGETEAVNLRSLTTAEIELIECYRKADAEKQDVILKTARWLAT